MVTKHKYFGRENIGGASVLWHSWETTSRCCHPPPALTPGGRDEFCPQILIQFVSTRMSFSWGVDSLWNAGKTTGIFHGDDTFANRTGQPASILCGNLARFSISLSCCIALADECVSLLRKRTKIIWKSSLQSLGVCMTLHVCIFVSL